MGEAVSIRYGKVVVWVPDGMEWELENIKTGSGVDADDFTSDLEFAFWIAEQLDIGISRVQVTRVEK